MFKPPLDAKLSLLRGYRLEVRCRCKLSYVPLSMLADRSGGGLQLGEVLPRLKCRTCGERPSEVALVDDPAAGASGTGRRPQSRIILK